MASAAIDRISFVEIEKEIPKKDRPLIKDDKICNSFLADYFKKNKIKTEVKASLSLDKSSYLMLSDQLQLHNQKVYVYNQYFSRLGIKNNHTKVIVDEDSKQPIALVSHLDNINLIDKITESENTDLKESIQNTLQNLFGTSDIFISSMYEVLFYADDTLYDKKKKIEPAFFNITSNADLIAKNEKIKLILNRHVPALQCDIQIVANGTALDYEIFFRIKTGEIIFVESQNFSLFGDFKVNTFVKDPPSEKGSDLTWTDSIHEINSYKHWREIKDVVITNNTIKNQFIEVTEFSPPTNSSFSTSLPNHLDFHILTDQFAAINAFSHWNHMIRTISKEFKLFDLIKNINYPILVDINSSVNGALVHRGPKGTYRVCFERIKPDPDKIVSLDTISLSISNRVSWHELLHVILRESFGKGHIGFAEGTGDAVAAIMNDPGINSDKFFRFKSFPWANFSETNKRMHDRSVQCWYEFKSPESDGEYFDEQVFSSALFRFYQCIGGDSKSDLVRTHAAKYTVYLHLKAIGGVPNSNFKIDYFVNLLKIADEGGLIERYPGKTLRKVIRWAFRNQGLFRYIPANYYTLGDPPSVDLTLRGKAEKNYGYRVDLESTAGIIKVSYRCDSKKYESKLRVGINNFIKIKVKNIGNTASDRITVRLYSKLITDNNWYECKISSACAITSIPSLKVFNKWANFGTFEFNPKKEGTYQLLAVAECKEDIPISYLKTKQPNSSDEVAIHPLEYLIPFDNNMALRTIQAIN